MNAAAHDISLSRRHVLIGGVALTLTFAAGRIDVSRGRCCRRRTQRPEPEPMGVDRFRRLDLDHVARDRDGAGLHDLAAAYRCRRARRRLEQGARRSRAADRRGLWQPRLRRHALHRGQQRRAQLLRAASPCRRRRASRPARECRASAARAGLRAHNRAKRCCAREVGPPFDLWRNRRARHRGSRDARAGDGCRVEARQRLPPDRSRHHARRAAQQGQRQRAICHRRAGPGHAVRDGAARTRRRLRP